MAIAASLVAVAATATVSFYLAHENIALVKHETLRNVRGILDYSAARLEYPTFLGDTKLVKARLKELVKANHPIVFVEVRDSEGAVLGTAGDPSLASAVVLDDGSSKPGRDKDGADRHAFVQPAQIPKKGLSGHFAASPLTLTAVKRDTEDPFAVPEAPGAAKKPKTVVLGSVSMFVSDSATRAAVAKVRLLATAIATLMAVLIALASYVLASTMVQPIHDLLKATRRVAEGDLDVTLEVKAEDELGHLAGSFNKMASELRTSYAQLNEYSTDLERKVAQRTRQFEEANRDLAGANREMADMNQRLTSANAELMQAADTITLQQNSLVRAAKMASIGTMAAGIAHEINNPLAIIAGYSEALINAVARAHVEDNLQLAKLPRYLEVINSECFRCKEITQGLLTLSREKTLSRKSGNINAIVNKAIELANAHPKHNSQSVMLDMTPVMPDIACDPDQLGQVFLNLAIRIPYLQPAALA